MIVAKDSHDSKEYDSMKILVRMIEEMMTVCNGKKSK
jgi:hypothetical protein